MSSLFRIDRNSIHPDAINSARVAVLPKLEDVHVAHEVDEEDEEAAPVVAGGGAEARVDSKIERKKHELSELKKQVADTEAYVKKMMQDAEGDAQGIREEAKEAGYEEGLRQVREEYAEELKREKAQVQKFLQALKMNTTKAYEEILASTLELSLFIAERIIKREFEQDDEVFLDIVRDTIGKVKNQNQLVLRVNKEEFDKFFADEQDEFVDLLKSSGIEIRKDLAIDCGECAIDTEYGTLRSGIRTQLERMGHALREAE